MPWVNRLICRACETPVADDRKQFKAHCQSTCVRWLHDREQPPPRTVTTQREWDPSRQKYCCHLCFPRHSGKGRFDGCFLHKYDQARHEWKKHKTYKLFYEPGPDGYGDSEFEDPGADEAVNNADYLPAPQPSSHHTDSPTQLSRKRKRKRPTLSQRPARKATTSSALPSELYTSAMSDALISDDLHDASEDEPAPTLDLDPTTKTETESVQEQTECQEQAPILPKPAWTTMPLSFAGSNLFSLYTREPEPGLCKTESSTIKTKATSQKTVTWRAPTKVMTKKRKCKKQEPTSRKTPRKLAPPPPFSPASENGNSESDAETSLPTPTSSESEAFERSQSPSPPATSIPEPTSSPTRPPGPVTTIPQHVYDSNILRGLWYGHFYASQLMAASIEVRHAALAWYRYVGHIYPELEHEVQLLENQTTPLFDRTEKSRVFELLGFDVAEIDIDAVTSATMHRAVRDPEPPAPATTSTTSRTTDDAAQPMIKLEDSNVQERTLPMFYSAYNNVIRQDVQRASAESEVTSPTSDDESTQPSLPTQSTAPTLSSPTHMPNFSVLVEQWERTRAGTNDADSQLMAWELLPPGHGVFAAEVKDHQDVWQNELEEEYTCA